MLSTAREAGAVMLVLYALPRLAFTQLLGGRWDAARSTAVEALGLSRSAGPRALTAPPLAWLTLLAALQGRPQSTSSSSASSRTPPGGRSWASWRTRCAT